MYAVKNGHSPVAAYLLRIGVNPCAADTSGNTPIHYAAAYGWLHCLKMLMEAGADPNAANQWKVGHHPYLYLTVGLHHGWIQDGTGGGGGGVGNTVAS